MALLAFLGAGHTHLGGEYQQPLALGIKSLMQMQGDDGNFFQRAKADSNVWFYSHAQCTIVVCRLYGMTKDEQLRLAAEKAVQFLIDSQDPELGGWRYLPRSDSDTSVTGWVVMALHNAREAGLAVPDSVLKKVGQYLDKATSDGSKYGYQSGAQPTIAMTAEALFCRQCLGWQRDDPRIVAGADILLKHLPHYEERDVYYWFFGAQALRQMGGNAWADWGAALRTALVKQQEETGPEKGSWEPLGEHPDRWSNLGQGGRLYTTCLSLFALEAN